MTVKYMVNMMEHDDSQVYGEHDGDLLAEDGVGVEESQDEADTDYYTWVVMVIVACQSQ